MQKPDKKTILLTLLLVAVFAALLYALQASGLLGLFLNKQRLLGFIEEHHTYAALIFIGLQAAQVVAAPIPGEVTGFAGGIIFGPASGIFYSTVGLTIGSWLAFMLARLLGRPLVERVIKPETIQHYDYVMQHKGKLLAFLMFLIPGFPKDFLCYLLGLGHMRQRDFLLVSASGRLLGTILLTLGGSYFRNAHYGALFMLASGSLALILLIMIYRDRIEQTLRRMSGVLHKIPKKKKSPPSE